ncbi:MAG: M12 family metallo-peptidase [Planctomycetota bacterium]|nr:M12 family metallo-peptidase [Planctomycetota bacterium]
MSAPATIRNRLGRMGLITSLGTLLAVVLAGHADPGSAYGRGHVRSAPGGTVPSGLGLDGGRLIRPDVEVRPDGSLSVALPARAAPHRFGRLAYLDLDPVSVRAAEYALLVQQADGSLQRSEAGPVETYRGRVRGMPGTVVAAALREGGLEARIRFPDEQELWLQPVASHLDGAPPDQHVAYYRRHITRFSAPCWVEQDAAPAGARAKGMHAALPDEPFVAELAVEVDAEYLRACGDVAAVEQRIGSLVNALNLQFEREVGITHRITALVVRRSDDGGYAATDPADLTRQFRDHWRHEHGELRRDVAQLFTGRSLDEDAAGWAFVGGVRDADRGYSVVRSDWSPLYAGAVDLCAHQLGHNWGAVHCRGDGESFTMNRRITGANRFDPRTSMAAIRAFRDGLSGAEGPNPPSPPPSRPVVSSEAASSQPSLVWGGRDEEDPNGAEEGDEEEEPSDPGIVLSSNGGEGPPPVGFVFGFYSLCDEASEEQFSQYPKAPTIGHHHFDPGGTGTPDLAALREAVDTMIPDETYDGFVCIDAEKEYSRRMIEEPVGSPLFEENLDNLEAILTTVAEMRPRARLTLWGWPLIGLWCPPGVPYDEATEEQLAAVRQRWQAAGRVYRHLAWWNLSAYDPYPDAGEYESEEERLKRRRIHASAKAHAVALATELDPEKPIIAAIWIRTGDWTDDTGYRRLLPVAEVIRDQIQTTRAAGADGWVYWQANRWHYQHNAIPEDEIPPHQPWSEAKGYFMGLEETYIPALATAVGAAP